MTAHEPPAEDVEAACRAVHPTRWEHRAIAHPCEECATAVTAAAPVIATAATARAHTALDELAHERDEARQQVADLRAGIEALLPGETVNVYAGGGNLVSQRRVVDPDHLRTLLAESGEQPGECPECGDAMCRCGIDWTAPVVPDSADVRDELLHVLDSHGIDTYIDGTGAEVGVQNLITDILAVVGRGVTAEQAWDEGYRSGYRDRRLEASYEPGGNPYRQREADRDR